MRPSLKKKPNVELSYRVYYNPETKICTQKSIDEINGLQNFIYVDKTTYEGIEFCSLYRINANNKLERIPQGVSRIALNLKIDGGFVTLKNNMLFVTESVIEADIDRWDFI